MRTSSASESAVDDDDVGCCCSSRFDSIRVRWRDAEAAEGAGAGPGATSFCVATIVSTNRYVSPASPKSWVRIELLIKLVVSCS